MRNVIMRGPDGCAHFSDLKYMAESPLHYRHRIENPSKPTRAMRLGTAAHFHLLGERVGLPLVVWEGGMRKGAAWEKFEAENAGVDILSKAEFEIGRNIAAATLADPVARALLDGAQYEVPIKWNDGGIECSTWGLDIVGRGGKIIADYKTTQSTKPEKLKTHAIRMMWHAQLAMYGRGAHQVGIPWEKLFLIATESSPPYATTVLEVTPAMIEEGEKCVTAWIELLRSCEDNNHWPGYEEHVVPWDPPAWMSMGLDLADGLSADDEEAAE